jgi:vacuolar protein sorting-associated protein 35
MLSRGQPEMAVKLYLEMSLTADSFAFSQKTDDVADYAAIAYELLSQAVSLYEETVTDIQVQQRCIRLMVGTLLASQSLSKDEYESLITKTAQFSAKVPKKPDQCQLVGLCANLFYPTEGANATKYQNPQRALECLQRSLKLADACTSANPSNVDLFVDLMEHYVHFFEKKNPVITHAYISGLAALVKEQLNNLGSFGGDVRAVSEAKAHFFELIKYIKMKKSDEATSELFGPIQIDGIVA